MTCHDSGCQPVLALTVVTKFHHAAALPASKNGKEMAWETEIRHHRVSVLDEQISSSSSKYTVTSAASGVMTCHDSECQTVLALTVLTKFHDAAALPACKNGKEMAWVTESRHHRVPVLDEQTSSRSSKYTVTEAASLNTSGVMTCHDSGCQPVLALNVVTKFHHVAALPACKNGKEMAWVTELRHHRVSVLEGQTSSSCKIYAVLAVGDCK